MNRSSSSRLTATTLSLAVAAAAFLVFCGEPDPTHVPPQEISMLNLKQLFQQISQHLRKMRLERETMESLSTLDARTLADIGIHASEIPSISAEWLREATLTRLRIAEEHRRA